MLKKVLMLVVGIGLLAAAGCGGGGGSSSSTNGTLTLSLASTDMTGGLYQVVATAVFSSPWGNQGVDIKVATSTHTLNGTPVVTSEDLYTDATGTVTKTLNITQSSEPLYVDVTVSNGGLVNTKTVTIPAAAAP